MWYFVLKACLEHRGFDGNTILAVTEDNFVLGTMVNDAMLVIIGNNSVLEITGIGIALAIMGNNSVHAIT